MSSRSGRSPKVIYSFSLICTILASCASGTSGSKSDSGTSDDSPSVKEFVVKLEDKIIELETRITALNEKINLEQSASSETRVRSDLKTETRPLPEAKLVSSGTIPVQKVQPAPAAKNPLIPNVPKAKNRFAESFQNDEATDRYREAKILFDAHKPADSILEFSDFLKDHPRHVLAGNAQYYIGMGYFLQKEYKLAEEELSRVLINYPYSNAVPDTLVALIQVCEILQKPARVTYFREKLQLHFANSPQAKSIQSMEPNVVKQ